MFSYNAQEHIRGAKSHFQVKCLDWPQSLMSIFIKTDNLSKIAISLPSELHVITRYLHVFTCNNIYVEYSD